MYDAADETWNTGLYGETLKGQIGKVDALWATVYDDRPLTRREWVKVRILRRSDPRVTDLPVRTALTYAADGTFKID
jgi:hypothetical protein